MVGISSILIGIALLLFGRKLFWLLVGSIGFLIGLELASRITFQTELFLVLAALGLGLLFALLAIFVETVAIGVAGFVGGGLTAMRFVDLLGMEGPISRSLAFLAGGILGVLLIVLLFNWALITLSSLSGASLVVSGLLLRPAERPLVLLALIIMGVAVQGIALSREDKPGKPQAVPRE